MPSFLGGKSHGALGQPAFFLGGSRMTIVAFEKEVSLKAQSATETKIRRIISAKFCRRLSRCIYIYPEN